jgi:hypothetical protein
MIVPVIILAVLVVAISAIAMVLIRINDELESELDAERRRVWGLDRALAGARRKEIKLLRERGMFSIADEREREIRRGEHA